MCEAGGMDEGGVRVCVCRLSVLVLWIMVALSSVSQHDVRPTLELLRNAGIRVCQKQIEEHTPFFPSCFLYPLNMRPPSSPSHFPTNPTYTLPPPSPIGVDVDGRQTRDSHHHRPQLQTHFTITSYFHFQAGETID